ncbi:MAG TPA: cyclodeaminase/cyclohydrolase family protein, partial [Candidatus Limnocylindria bacterium]|nr:cyclodeaminase/cyclohydrolase family protein [Candidatus Limnocylindria bacterium]
RGQAEQEQDLISEVSDAATSRRRELLDLAQADADAYAAVVAARRLPRDGEPAGERSQRIGAATRQATLVPLRTAEAAAAVLELSARIAPVGNRNAVSDVGVAAQLASASVRAAVLNVRINLPGLPADDGVRRDAAARAEELWGSVVRREADVVALVTRRMATTT